MSQYVKKLQQFISGMKVRGKTGYIINYLWPQHFMKNYEKYLKCCGVVLNGKPNYIASDVYFDGHDYSLISLGKDIVISKGVTLLTHDYSIARGIQAVIGKQWEHDKGATPFFLKPISIGDNCFIGAGSILLPGTNIGRDCIIGSHAVVKGTIPDNSIVVGNPGKIIAKTSEWAEKHMKLKDYYPKDIIY